MHRVSLNAPVSHLREPKMARHLHVSPFPPKSSGKAPYPWTTASGWRADELPPWGEG